MCHFLMPAFGMFLGLLKSLQWSHKEKKYLIEEKEDDLLPALMPPPVVKFEL